MKSGYKILIVDDNAINRSILKDILEDEYGIIEASNGLEAIDILDNENQEILLVLLDIIMPVMDGFKVLETMSERGWIQNIPVIVISSEMITSHIDNAYDLGVTDYINRPFDTKTVKRRISNTLLLATKRKRLEEIVADQVLENEKNSALMINILSNIVEFRNGESGLHVLHIRIITEILLKHLMRMTDKYHLTPEDVILICNASSLHDIGKMSIPEEILNKPARLTPEEFEIIKTHSAAGAEIIKKTSRDSKEPLLVYAHDICRWHHERYDGRGYPDGLVEDDIPIAAQVVSLADVYDALISKRVYKPAYTHEQAIQMILNGECGVFNPLLLECLKDASHELNAKLTQVNEDTMSEIETRHIVEDVVRSGGKASRTLALLEQERMKFQFYATIADEILFEYSYNTDILTFSEYGAELLGVPVLIKNPRRSLALRKIFDKGVFEAIVKLITRAIPNDALINEVILLHFPDKQEYHKIIMKHLWEDEEKVRLIGKFVNVNDEYMEKMKLRIKAETDQLTGLINQETAQIKVHEILSKNPKERYCLLIIDIDFFKTVNDYEGHLRGNEILQKTADHLKMWAAPDSVVARIGGDEFLIFCRYEENVKAKFNDLLRIPIDDLQFRRLTVSIGAAIYPAHGKDYKTLFEHADRALYFAKATGKDRYAIYERSLEILHIQKKEPTE